MSLKDKITGLLQRLHLADEAKAAPYAAPEAVKPDTVSSLQDMNPETMYKSLDSVNVEVVREVRIAAASDLDFAGLDLEGTGLEAATDMHAGIPDEWVSRDAAGKRPNHSGSMMRQ